MNLVKISDELFIPEDFDKNHSYFADAEGKKRYTGITTVISVLAKPALIGWAARMAVEHIQNCDLFILRDGLATIEPSKLVRLLEEAKNAHTKKKEAAGEHGTDSHALVEAWINYLLTEHEGRPINDYAFDGDDPILKFKAWAVENVDHFLFAERRMANKELFLAGTADFAYVGKDGKRYMADFKTSSGIYGVDYFLQVAAYRLLAEGEGDEPYDGSTVIRLGKDGDFEVLHRYDYETDKEAFVACLTLYRAQATFKKPKK